MLFSVTFILYSYFKGKIYIDILLNDKLVKSCYNEINIDYNFYIISAMAQSDEGLKK